ncbi:MAG: SOS response-associated peptidase [Balneolaceae bacterium]|nr:SOS response-associated peptidase [Balneolaceae bacterium]
MCNFYDAHYYPAKLTEQFGTDLNLPEEYQGSYKVSPTNYSPIVRVNQKGNRVAEESYFKLIPSFADSKHHKYSTMNARDDKLLSKRGMWKPYFETQRCIVPATGFYEHYTLSEPKHIEGLDKPTDKVPFRIGLKSADLFGFAGVWNTWTDPNTGEVILSHAIITTDPNETVKKIHNTQNRMAMILPQSAYDLWLGDVDKGEDLFDANLFKPWPDEDMEYFQVNKQFDYGLRDETLRNPVQHQIRFEGEQRGLF